jgi:hypothetical protein
VAITNVSGVVPDEEVDQVVPLALERKMPFPSP